VHSPLMMQVAGTGEAPYVAPSRKITLRSSPFVSYCAMTSAWKPIWWCWRSSGWVTLLELIKDLPP
jgi:hypothetical protein